MISPEIRRYLSLRRRWVERVEKHGASKTERRAVRAMRRVRWALGSKDRAVAERLGARYGF